MNVLVDSIIHIQSNATTIDFSKQHTPQQTINKTISCSAQILKLYEWRITIKCIRCSTALDGTKIDYLFIQQLHHSLPNKHTSNHSNQHQNSWLYIHSIIQCFDFFPFIYGGIPLFLTSFIFQLSPNSLYLYFLFIT